MNRAATFLVLFLAIVGLLAISGALAPDDDPPLGDHHLAALIIESRQAAQTGQEGTSTVAVTLALIIAAGAVTLLLHFGGRFLKQARLLLRKRARSRPAQLPPVPTLEVRDDTS